MKPLALALLLLYASQGVVIRNSNDPDNLSGEPALVFMTTFPSTATTEAGVTRICAEAHQQYNPNQNDAWNDSIICSNNDYITDHGNAGGGNITSGHPNGDEIISAANYTGGAGGRGFRHYRADGQNVNGGGIKLQLKAANGGVALNKIYIRFHMRYQFGFAWSSTGETLDYTKDLYGLYTDAPMPNWTFGFHGGVAGHMWVWRGLGCGTQTTCGDGTVDFTSVNGGATGDGLFHCYQLHIDATNDGNDTVQAWVDGVSAISSTTVDFGAAGGGLDELVIGSNQNIVANGGMDVYTDYDDIAVSTVGMPSCLGNGPGALLDERFENASFAARGWTDGATSNSASISTTNTLFGSAGAFECAFTTGNNSCTAGSPRRHSFTATESVYLSYHVKHSSSYVGSQNNAHPHMFILITTDDGGTDSTAYSHIEAYIENNMTSNGRPQLVLQDGENIDENNIGVNLIGVTENRAVAGCNGDGSEGANVVECYSIGKVHTNGKHFYPATGYFSGTAGAFYKGDYHQIEAYVRLNTVIGGVGQADGIARYWYDGSLIWEKTNIIYRTGQRATAKFDKLFFEPYIDPTGSGSPANQTMWIDNLLLKVAP